MGKATTLLKAKTPKENPESANMIWSTPEKIMDIFHRLGGYAWMHDFSNETTHFSKEYNHFIGYSPSEMSQERGASIWWKSIDPAFQSQLVENDHKYKDGLQDHHSIEFRIKDRKGKWRWVLEKGAVLQMNQNGKPQIVIGTHLDITELKEIREQLEEDEYSRKRQVVDAIIRNLEADRSYMASELHNNINQILAAARMMLELIPMVNEEMGEYTKKVKYIIYNAVDEVNKICNLINPDSLDHVSLPELLKDQIKRAAKEKDIRIKLDINGFLGGKRFPKDSELTMLRVVQDIVHRITEYSKATDASIVLTQEKDILQLDVSFNDPKFDLARTQRNLRVTNLISRCEHFGGYYKLAKDKGKGITLKAAVKIHLKN